MGNDDEQSQGVEALSSLKQQRSIMKRNITNMKTKVDKEGDTADSITLECRLQILESHFRQISHIQGQIEKITPDDSSRSDIEESYIEAKGNASTSHPFTHQNRLPKLKLPKFDGKYCEYKRFSHSFSNLVNDDPTIPTIEKFNYLINCLSGQALAIVEPFQITEENYPKALARLKERYDNNVLIFLDYISSLFSLQSMNKADPTTLRTIIDKVSAIRSSLLSLGSEMDILNSIIIHIVLSKIDNGSKIVYEEKQEQTSLPTWDQCYAILTRRCQLLESRVKGSESLEQQRDFKTKSNQKKPHAFVNSKSACLYCNGSEHVIGSCSAFLALPVNERFDFVKRSGMCVNCLRKGHSVANCPSKFKCRVCKASHHTHLHVFSVAKPSAVSSVNHAFDSNTSQAFSAQNTLGQGNAISMVARSFKRVIIPTAVVMVKDKFGIFQPVRALLDSGSEVNFMTEETAKRLQLNRLRFNQDISGIGDIHTQIKHAVAATIRSRFTDFEWSARFAVTKSISAKQPGEYIRTDNWNIPEGINLADPLFNQPQRVDLLISTEVFFEILYHENISLGKGLPSLTNTALGWIVGGKVEVKAEPRSLTCNVVANSSSLDELLRKFWEVEEVAQHSSPLSEEEKRCEKHFCDNVAVTASGRIQVSLPFKECPGVLGNSFETARKRFLSLERRLCRDEFLHNMYCEFMDEYESLGHMSKVGSTNLDYQHYVIPHHCVLRPESTTTKLRVVFDASASTSSNRSLNDILMVGPTIQQELLITLLSFRLHRYALTADIAKMYRQFLINESDRNFQLVLWRKSKDEPLNIYQLNTVTYGMASAPFLAIRCLFFIADSFKDTYPIGARVLKEDLYVDDLLTGCDTEKGLEEIRNEVTELLSCSGLHLAKWNSNSSNIISDKTTEIPIKSGDETITKALGMAWKPMVDMICFRFEFLSSEKITKRSILSCVARIFDVLGLLSPIVIRCKILMQELWIQQVEWDEPLPKGLADLWLQIAEDLPQINKIEVPRFGSTFPHCASEIHGFADASSRAYGCAIYVGTLVEGSFQCTLLISKSKLAPIKSQSIPKLELCAALLLNRTWNKIKHKLQNYGSRVFFWTDSKVVLHWLKQHASTLNCFVANRVSEIQENSRDISWRHVPTKSNPADIVSRGCSASDVLKTMWFSGPPFLQSNEDNWPVLDTCTETPDLERRHAVSFKCDKENYQENIFNIIIENCSSFRKILRIISYLYRVFNRVPSNPTLIATNVVHISSSELDDAFWRIVANIQWLEYKQEIESLKRGKPLTANLQRLSPFLQEMKIGNINLFILRVGGRLQNADMPYEEKHPALLPKTHRFTQLYISFLHTTNLHAGAKVLLSILQQRIWVVNAREVVRKIVRNCVHCFHYKPKLMSQVMGDIPKDRVTAQIPFTVCGVDFCGPFFTSLRIRGRPPYKTYAAIFVCFSSKATHIELVSDLSTNSFLLCLKRFISRRGTPYRLYCDNATNFVGARNKLKEFQANHFNQRSLDAVLHYSSDIGLEFRFIPPRAPHFGGLWEAAVKSAKTLLVKNMAKANLTYEELQSLLIEIEAILNSRPILALSNDPNDGPALTPGHFLIGKPLKAMPSEKIESNKNIASLTKFQQITFLKNQFWQQWRRDYLQELQQRMKWNKAETKINLGHVVIVQEDNLPPQQWLLARIIGVSPGADGKIRVVDLQTKKGIIRRAIHKLAPLPFTENA